MLWYSLLGTLAMKHKSTIKEIISIYSLAPFVKHSHKTDKGIIKEIVLVKYPTWEYFSTKKKEFKKYSLAPIDLEKILKIKVNLLYSLNDTVNVTQVNKDKTEVQSQVYQFVRRFNGG